MSTTTTIDGCRLMLLVLYSCVCSTLPFLTTASFIKVPSSQTVKPGEAVTFYCRHQTTNLINWRVNYTLLSLVPPSDVTPSMRRDEDGAIVNTLTISASSEYNETVVECEAVFRDGSQPEVSTAAVLLVEDAVTKSPMTPQPPLKGSHDIHNLSATSTHPGEIRLTFDLISGSTAFRVLAVLYSLSSNDSSAQYELINREKEETVFSGLAEGPYVVSLFVMDENWKPLQHVAVQSLTVDVMEGSRNSVNENSLVEHMLTYDPTGVNITCTFPSSSPAIGCLAVVHQPLPQLNASELTTVETYILLRHGDIAEGRIAGVVLGEEEIRVIAIEPPQQVDESSFPTVAEPDNIPAIIITVMAIALSLFFLVMLIWRSYSYRQQRRKGHTLRGLARAREDNKQANAINHYEPLPFSYQQPSIDQENTVSPNSEPIYAELSEVVESFTSVHSNSTVHPVSNSDYFTDNSNPQDVMDSVVISHHHSTSACTETLKSEEEEERHEAAACTCCDPHTTDKTTPYSSLLSLTSADDVMEQEKHTELQAFSDCET